MFMVIIVMMATRRHEHSRVVQFMNKKSQTDTNHLSDKL